MQGQILELIILLMCGTIAVVMFIAIYVSTTIYVITKLMGRNKPKNTLGRLSINPRLH